MKKNNNRTMFWIIGTALGLVVLCSGYGISHMVFKAAGWSAYLAEYLLGILIGGGLGLILIGCVSHKKGHFHQDFYDQVYKALDDIAEGKFDISIQSREVDNHPSFKRIADQVEYMADQLSVMDMMRKDFVSNVSHEIQSPLTAIKGFINLLKMDDVMREEREKYLHVIDVEINRLSNLSDNLLKLSALDAGSAVVCKENYRLDRQIREAVLVLEPLWNRKQIEFSLELPEMSVWMDRELTAQIWHNLLSNAIKFSDPGGLIEVWGETCSDGIKIAVRDHGPGMTEAVKAKVFERFYVGDKARKRDEGGNGLGLSIVKKIVKLQDGEIWVESAPGEGSCFIVFLKTIETV